MGKKCHEIQCNQIAIKLFRQIKTRFKILSTLTFIFFFISCGSAKDKCVGCEYTLSRLLEEYGSKKFTVKTDYKDGFVHVFEHRNKYGEAGLYYFDSSGRIRFYAFLIDSTNFVDFSIEYDSKGCIINRTGSEVVNGYFRKSEDSIKATFFLNSINTAYSNINVRVGNKIIEIDTLYQSDFFSNILGRTISLPCSWVESEPMLYVKGLKRNLCTNKVNIFIDSTLIPNEVR
ncbi:MAG: hypothetical protein KDC06_08765 [Chitinophagaceae bacterium]|nr:hypothetical protein [Chitinophagaceae bacterium]